jgi:DNA replication and repair protein RecF
VHLQKLSLINFKNHQQADLDFTDTVNCFTGNNGSGKTNLLDAIYYLALTKSFFNPIDSQNISHDQPFFVIQGTFKSKEEDIDIYCGVKKGMKKAFKRNKREYQRLSEHIGQFPCVMVSPADNELIYEGSDERRKFVDGILSQIDSDYLEKLMIYNKALAQRNALLGHFYETNSFDGEQLEIWDIQMENSGNIIYEKRKEFIARFIQLFRKHYTYISGGSEVADLHYESQLHGSSLSTLLSSALRKDTVAGYTSVGIHKDDIEFKLGDYSLKKYGSQGQQKSMLIALRLAQFDIIKEHKGINPILLLDDIYDKLDDSRVQKLMELVSSNHFGQIFLTDTGTERVKYAFNKINVKHKVFVIDAEQIKSA